MPRLSLCCQRDAQVRTAHSLTAGVFRRYTCCSPVISTVFSPETHTFFGTPFRVPDSHTFPRNRVFGQRKLTERAGIGIGNPTIVDTRHSDFHRPRLLPISHPTSAHRLSKWPRAE